MKQNQNLRLCLQDSKVFQQKKIVLQQNISITHQQQIKVKKK